MLFGRTPRLTNNQQKIEVQNCYLEELKRLTNNQYKDKGLKYRTDINRNKKEVLLHINNTGTEAAIFFEVTSKAQPSKQH